MTWNFGLGAQELSDCSVSKYECCPDGITASPVSKTLIKFHLEHLIYFLQFQGPKFEGCDIKDISEKVLLEKSKEFDESISP